MVFTRKKVVSIFAIVAVFITAYFYFGHHSVIKDFNYQRDHAAIREIFDRDWDWLIPVGKDEYSLDLLLKDRAPQQNPLYAGRLYIKVAREQDQLIGFVAYYSKKQTEWFFNFLDVNPEYRNKGYARKLAKAAIADMVSRGAQRITLVTYPHNERALNLYKSLGFVPIAYGRQVELEYRVH